jgi:hypothetical protein
MITNELKIAKTNDIKGAYRLKVRIQEGTALEAAQAYLEASVLCDEATDRFFELIDRSTYSHYMPAYVRILLNKDKVQKYIDRNVIHGDRLNQLLIAHTITYYTDEELETKFQAGELKAWMHHHEIKMLMGIHPCVKRRQTKKVKEEHNREFRSAYFEYIAARCRKQ